MLLIMGENKSVSVFTFSACSKLSGKRRLT